MNSTEGTSATAVGGSALSEGLGPEVDAGGVSAGQTLYEVTYAHGHKTLKVGDHVRMAEDAHYNNTLVRTDWTQHLLADENGQYVHLREVPMVAGPNDKLSRPQGPG